MFASLIKKHFLSLATKNILFQSANCSVYSKANKLSKIGTHNGTFHCDEVLGCSMLKILSPNAVIIRSRDPDVLKSCDVVIDVGGVYDLDNMLFDHHQKGFNLTANSLVPELNSDIKLSSAGLIYCTLGKEIIKKLIDNCSDKSLIDVLFLKAYEFIQEIDAVDNGVPLCEGPQRYIISTHLSDRIKHLNPSWNDKNPNVEAQFNKAMKLAGEEFTNEIDRLYKRWLPARTIVKDALEKRYSIDSSGEIIELDIFCPWSSHLFELEKELKIEPKIKYVIFPASQARTVWRVESVSVEEGSFILRKPLNKDWRGLQDDELRQISGIEGCIFVHSTGFYGGNSYREGAFQMAKKSLEM